MELKTCEQFPGYIVLLSVLFSLTTYIMGILILTRFGLWLVILYVLYCIWMEFRVLYKGCVNCYYYGKRCGTGKGIVCAWFFKPGKTENFNAGEMSWLEILPDFMVTIIPLIFGIISLILGFSWLILLSITILIMLATAGNSVIRGQFLCRFCKQRELGCPADKLFSAPR